MKRNERTKHVSVQDAAEELIVSASTIRRLLAKKKFPRAFRVGRQIRIPKSDLDAFQAREALDHDFS